MAKNPDLFPVDKAGNESLGTEIKGGEALARWLHKLTLVDEEYKLDEGHTPVAPGISVKAGFRGFFVPSPEAVDSCGVLLEEKDARRPSESPARPLVPSLTAVPAPAKDENEYSVRSLGSMEGGSALLPGGKEPERSGLDKFLDSFLLGPAAHDEALGPPSLFLDDHAASSVAASTALSPVAQSPSAMSATASARPTDGAAEHSHSERTAPTILSHLARQRNLGDKKRGAQSLTGGFASRESTEGITGGFASRESTERFTGGFVMKEGKGAPQARVDGSAWSNAVGRDDSSSYSKNEGPNKRVRGDVPYLG